MFRSFVFWAGRSPVTLLCDPAPARSRPSASDVSRDIFWAFVSQIFKNVGASAVQGAATGRVEGFTASKGHEIVSLFFLLTDQLKFDSNLMA